MTEERRKYLNDVAVNLYDYIRTVEGFAPHPMYFDDGVIDYLDNIVREFGVADGT